MDSRTIRRIDDVPLGPTCLFILPVGIVLGTPLFSFISAGWIMEISGSGCHMNRVTGLPFLMRKRFLIYIPFLMQLHLEPVPCERDCCILNLDTSDVFLISKVTHIPLPN
jgi:hypothetical protein